MEFSDDAHFFCFGTEILFLEKLVPHYQICYRFLFKLFSLIIASVCFGNLNKIPENASAQQNFLLMNHIEWNKDVNTVSYLKWLTFGVFMLPE